MEILADSIMYSIFEKPLFKDELFSKNQKVFQYSTLFITSNVYNSLILCRNLQVSA